MQCKNSGIIQVSFVVFLWLQFSGCCGCGTNDANRRTYCVSINNTSLVAYNNNGSEPVLASANDEVYGEALVLELNFDNNLALCYQRRNVNPFVNTAYATSCRYNDYYRYGDSIAYVTISADKDYDAQHPAGAELNEYFRMPEMSELNQENEMTSTMIYAQHAPEQSGLYVYTMTVLLANGTVIESSTEPVNIIK